MPRTLGAKLGAEAIVQGGPGVVDKVHTSICRTFFARVCFPSPSFEVQLQQLVLIFVMLYAALPCGTCTHVGYTMHAVVQDAVAYPPTGSVTTLVVPSAESGRVEWWDSTCTNLIAASE